jgi:hypothetical protein
MTSRYKGVDFSGATSIDNVPSDYSGAVSIAGNHIWENTTNSTEGGAILMNMKGYNGGVEYYRQFVVGNGKGTAIFGVSHPTAFGQDTITFNAPRVWWVGIPSSPAGLEGGMMYHDANGFLKLAGI